MRPAPLSSRPLRSSEAPEGPYPAELAVNRAAALEGVHGPSQDQELLGRLWQSPRTIMVGKALQRSAGLFVAAGEPRTPPLLVVVDELRAIV